MEKIITNDFINFIISQIFIKYRHYVNFLKKKRIYFSLE